MMRSQYADEGTDTYVEYTFIYQKKQYKILRNPEYMRLGKRKYADGSLRYVKETPKGRTDTAGWKCIQRKEERDGSEDCRNYRAGCRSVYPVSMIAQGEFSGASAG